MRSSPRLALGSGLLACLAVFALGAGLARAYNLTYASSAELAPHEAGGAASECAPGLDAYWGGFYSQLGAEGGAEPTGFLARGRGWRVLATNTGEEPRSVNIESYCEPARRHPPVERSTTVVLAPQTSASAVARCRPGETLLAGGFRNSIDPRPGRHVVVDGMQRVGVRNLRVTAANLSPDTPGRATAYAYCGHGRRPLAGRHTETVPPAGSTRLVARCPEQHRGEQSEVFFGFQGSPSTAATGAVVTPSQFRHGAKGKVIVTAVNRSLTEEATMTAFVYCKVESRFR